MSSRAVRKALKRLEEEKKSGRDDVREVVGEESEEDVVPENPFAMVCGCRTSVADRS
jgi:hypothetical protein